jgi:translation initiation factor eIF-2B subunit alpha
MSGKIPKERSEEEKEEEEEEDVPLVLQDLRRFLATNEPSQLFDKSETAVPVAAIKALLGVVQRSTANTMMGLQNELQAAADLMIAQQERGRSHIALQSGVELFLKYVTRTSLETPNFDECKLLLQERGERFQMISLAARDRIAVSASDFIPANATVLTHGWSRVVASILLEASKTKHFDVIVLEGRPDSAGAKAAQYYASETNIPVTLALDAAMGYVMEQADLVLTGAEGVVENGGVVNKVGTYALACCARAAGKPFYVAAESYKFARLYPLHQSDLPYSASAPLHFCDTTSKELAKIELDESIRVENPPVDFTPAKFITLLFTDLGVLTPAAVSDELIRLYQ